MVVSLPVHLFKGAGIHEANLDYEKCLSHI